MILYLFFAFITKWLQIMNDLFFLISILSERNCKILTNWRSFICSLDACQTVILLWILIHEIQKSVILLSNLITIFTAHKLLLNFYFILFTKRACCFTTKFAKCSFWFTTIIWSNCEFVAEYTLSGCAIHCYFFLFLHGFLPQIAQISLMLSSRFTHTGEIKSKKSPKLVLSEAKYLRNLRPRSLLTPR